MDNPITPLTSQQVQEYEQKAAHEGYFHRAIEEEDVALNVDFGGKQDETISSHAARLAVTGKGVGRIYGIAMSKFLNLFQKDHGAKAQAADLERAEAVVKLEKSDNILE